MSEEETVIIDDQIVEEDLDATEIESKKESKKKVIKSKPSWVKVKPAELEKMIIEMAKSGETPSKIGIVLRDQHGVPRTKMFGKKIVQILNENNIQYKTDKSIVQARVERLKAHSAKHKHDSCSSRALTKNLWAISRLGN